MTDPTRILPASWRDKMENKTGIYTGVSREEYDRIDRTNFSTLVHMKRSPAHFRAAKTE